MPPALSPEDPLRILSLDLGTRTGWAFAAKDYPTACGTFILANDDKIKEQGKNGMDRRGDIRFLALVDFLSGFVKNPGLDLIVFEDVQFLTTTQQSQLWATWRAAVWLMHFRHNVPTDCLPVKSLKKWATGDGKAEKFAMMNVLCRVDPRFKVERTKRGRAFLRDTMTGAELDDNTADALHLLRWAKQKYE